MAQPAHLFFVAPTRDVPLREIAAGPHVLPPRADLDHREQTRVHRAALPRGGRWIVRLFVLAIGVLGPTLAFAGEHDVSFDVEGVVRTVRTYATDAAELLERRSIRSDDADLVAGGALVDGDRVTYRSAKRVTLVVDGQKKTVVARGLTVGDAVKDLGLVPGPKDHVSPGSSTKLTSGLEIFVRNAVHTKLRVDGRLRDVVSSADSVEVLLRHAGVAVGPDDYVLPSREAEPTDGMWIRVVRVRRIQESRNFHIPYRMVTRHDPSMESGVRRVVQQGSEGLKVQRFSVLLEDGVRVSTHLVEETIVRSASDHIVKVGTRSPTFKGGGGTQTGIASWFAAEGLVAAHRSLPIGAVVKVTASNGKSVTVRINQRGPFVEGRVIDLSDDAFQRLAPLGQGTIKVTVHS